MGGQDAELDLFRTTINCATLLERLAPGWRLDRRESTRRALKYRRAKGEILIVNHDGRGWWDPLSAAKGDIFDLVQFLDPSLTFGQVRQVLRPFVGVAPTFPEASRPTKRTAPDRPLAERWQLRSRLRPGSPTWRYLTGARGLPPSVLVVADHEDAVREGPRGSGWFAHRDAGGGVTHIEIRGPAFKGSVRGGHKTLFRLAGGEQTTRLAMTEAPIDALSLAAHPNGCNGLLNSCRLWARSRYDASSYWCGGSFHPMHTEYASKAHGMHFQTASYWHMDLRLSATTLRQAHSTG